MNLLHDLRDIQNYDGMVRWALWFLRKSSRANGYRRLLIRETAWGFDAIAIW